MFVETGESSVRKLWISGPRKGEVDDVLTKLPGFPDNLKRDSRGGFLIGWRPNVTPPPIWPPPTVPAQDRAAAASGFASQSDQLRVRFAS